MSNKRASKQKIYSLKELLTKRAELAHEGKSVVFTNGVFDILHPGHTTYLEEAAALGNFLIIGLNNDNSVRSLAKGNGRPIQNEDARCNVLAALEAVDAVILFEEETPLSLINQIKPDILVKGGDYELEQIVGADVVLAAGGKVKKLPFLPGHSTSIIEQRIKQNG